MSKDTSRGQSFDNSKRCIEHINSHANENLDLLYGEVVAHSLVGSATSAAAPADSLKLASAEGLLRRGLGVVVRRSDTISNKESVDFLRRHF